MNRLIKAFQDMDSATARRKIDEACEKLLADLAEVREAHRLGLCVPCMRKLKEQESKESGK